MSQFELGRVSRDGMIWTVDIYRDCHRAKSVMAFTHDNLIFKVMNWMENHPEQTRAEKRRQRRRLRKIQKQSEKRAAEKELEKWMRNL